VSTTASQPTYQQQHALDNLMNSYAQEAFAVMGIEVLAQHDKRRRCKVSGKSCGNADDSELHMAGMNTSLFHCTTNKVKAFGWLSKKNGPKGFAVKVGSLISLTPVASFVKERAYGTWKTLVESDKVDNKGRLKVDCEFTSPSLAATIVKAGNANGWTEWVNDDGEPLDILRK